MEAFSKHSQARRELLRGILEDPSLKNPNPNQHVIREKALVARKSSTPSLKTAPAFPVQIKAISIKIPASTIEHKNAGVERRGPYEHQFPSSLKDRYAQKNCKVRRKKNKSCAPTDVRDLSAACEIIRSESRMQGSGKYPWHQGSTAHLLTPTQLRKFLEDQKRETSGNPVEKSTHSDSASPLKNAEDIEMQEAKESKHTVKTPKTILKPHQKEAIRWMRHRESLVRRDDATKHHSAPSKADKALERGGILADEMGIGKTLEMITHCLTSPPPLHAKHGPTLVVLPKILMEEWIKQAQTHFPDSMPTYYAFTVGKGPHADDHILEEHLSSLDFVFVTYNTLSEAYHALCVTRAEKLARIARSYHIEEEEIEKLQARVLASPWIWDPLEEDDDDGYGYGYGDGHDKEERSNSKRNELGGDSSPVLPSESQPRNNQIEGKNAAGKQEGIQLHGERSMQRDGKTRRSPCRGRNLLFALFWTRIVCDEGHKWRNPHTRLYRAMCSLRGAARWNMTGTPVQNSSLDLYAALNFLRVIHHPALRDPETWEEWFDSEIHAPRTIAGWLQQVMLRRLRSEVIPKPPGMATRYTIERVSFFPHEKETYLKFRNELQEAYKKARSEAHSSDTLDGGAQQKVQSDSILAKLFYLRNSCVGESKVRRLCEILLQVPAGEKSIVFCEWPSLFDAVAERLRYSGIASVRVSGELKSSERVHVLHRFQTEEDCPVLLLSLHIGCDGLNIIRANRVYFLEPGWNPSVEDQAACRVDRIGQTRPVFVTRLIMRDSIEERVLRVARKKSALSTTLIDTNREQVNYILREIMAEPLEPSPSPPN